MIGSKAGKLRSWLLCALMAFHSLFGFPNQSTAQSLSDTDSHWAEQEIKRGIAKGWISGYPDGTFQPDRSISRAEMAALFGRAGGFAVNVDAAEQIRYTDVASNAWYSDVVYAAAEAGVLNGYEDGSMRPNQPVSRQEAAVIMARMAQLEANETAAAKFSDALPAWSRGQIGASTAAGWISGYPDGSFRPNRLLSRAEAVVMLGRYLEAESSTQSDVVFDKAGTYGPAEGRMSVKGNVVVDSDKVTLRNMDIAGNLTFTDKLGEGDAELRNVRVAGTAFVHGGGERSIHIQDSEIKALTVDKKGSRVRIVVSGSSGIPTTTLLSGAILEENEATGAGFGHVLLSKTKSKEARAEALLRGSFDRVTLASSQWKLSLQRGAVNTLRIAEESANSEASLEEGTEVAVAVIEAMATFSGKGIIKKAELKANGIRFERNPDNVNCVSGVNHALCQPPTSSSGGSSTPKPTPTVTSVVYEPQQARLSYLGQEIQAEITAQWSDGSTTKVTSEAAWRSQDPAVATVSGTGAIRAVGEGQTYVEAIYKNRFVQIPVEVVIPSSVTDAYQVEALLAENTPVAGESNTLRLVVQRSDGSVDTAFSGLKKVAVSGFSQAPDGTIGKWNGVPVDDTATEFDVDFTDGEASVNLILHHAAAQTLVFEVTDVMEPEARQIVAPSPAEVLTADLQTQPSLNAVSGERLAQQPVIVLLDHFHNLAANSDLDVTASLSGSDAGSAALHGTTVISAVNGIASFTDLYLQGRGTGTGVVISFFPAGLAAVISDPIAIQAPFAGGNGTASDPYLVATAEQLYEVRYDLDAHFLQTEDIDLSAALSSSGEGWEPIGEGKIAPNGSLTGAPFTGTFDGSGKTIRHLTIKSQRGWSGLFGYIRNAELRDIHLENVSIEASHYSGGLVGYSIESRISESSVQGEVSGTTVFGGLVGYSLEGSIERSSSEVRLSASQSSHDLVIPVTGYIGGLVGGVHYGLIADSYSKGRIVTDGESYTAVGGLVGQFAGGPGLEEHKGKVERSYSNFEMNVRQGSEIGGLVGLNENGIVSDAYALGTLNVDLAVDQGRIGGLIGYSDKGIIRYSYSAVPVQGDLSKAVGGLVGSSDGAAYTSAYYDQEIAGLTDTGKGTPLSTENMKTEASFMDWKFDDTWSIVEGCSYPYLKGLSKNNLSCFKAIIEPEGITPIEGIPFELRLTEAQDAAGRILNETAAVVVTLNEGSESLFSGNLLFANGEARIPIMVGTAGAYTLTIEIANIVPIKSIAITIAPTTPLHPFASGAGTEADPYVIKTAAQLDAMRQYMNSYFKLNNDINLNVAPYNQGEGWQPIGAYMNNFKGSFDGGGHTITGLTINRLTADNNIGLFGYASNSVIRNLHLKDVQVASEGLSVGGLAGTIWLGTVENVSVQGTVKSKASFVGGVVGDFARGTMRFVYADVVVEGEYNVGGVAGVLSGEGYGSTIERSYSRGTVKATKNGVGGLVGWLERDCTIADSYSLAEVTGNANTGGLVGNVLGDVRNTFATGRVSNTWNYPDGGIGGFVSPDGKVTGSYYDRQTTTRWDTGNGDPKTTIDMKRESTFVNWDFSGIWYIDEGSSYPHLRWPD